MHAYPPTPANELNTDSNLYMAIAVFSFLHFACSTFSLTHSSHHYIRSMQCKTCIACTSARFITVLFHTASYAESIYHRSAEQRTFPTVHGSILVFDVFYSTDLPHKLLFIRSLCSSMKWILDMLENHCFCNVWNIIFQWIFGSKLNRFAGENVLQFKSTLGNTIQPNTPVMYHKQRLPNVVAWYHLLYLYCDV